MPIGPLRRLELIAALILVLIAGGIVAAGTVQFRDLSLSYRTGGRVPTCDHDIDARCPIPSYHDSVGGEPPGDDPVFTYCPGPSSPTEPAKSGCS